MRYTVVAIVMVLLLVGCAGYTKHRPAVLPFDQPDYKRAVRIGNAIIPRVDKGNVEKYRVSIVIDCIPGAWNNDRALVFTTGLFSMLDDNEVACVFAHEVAHSVLGHVRKRRAVSSAVTTVSLIANMVVPGTGNVNALANPLMTKAYSRKAESEADIAGVEYVDRYMGIDKECCATALEKLLDYARNNDIKTKGGLFSDHPGLEKRIEAIRDYEKK
ncbi:MAG: M48 family metalloprotease [Syntrophales bacterium]|nr:M48 family metalloprotease [Syntrophales bacterium]